MTDQKSAPLSTPQPTSSSGRGSLGFIPLPPYPPTMLMPGMPLPAPGFAPAPQPFPPYRFPPPTLAPPAHPPKASASVSQSSKSKTKDEKEDFPKGPIEERPQWQHAPYNLPSLVIPRDLRQSQIPTEVVVSRLETSNLLQRVFADENADTEELLMLKDPQNYRGQRRPGNANDPNCETIDPEWVYSVTKGKWYPRIKKLGPKLRTKKHSTALVLHNFHNYVPFEIAGVAPNYPFRFQTGVLYDASTVLYNPDFSCRHNIRSLLGPWRARKAKKTPPTYQGATMEEVRNFLQDQNNQRKRITNSELLVKRDRHDYLARVITKNTQPLRLHAFHKVFVYKHNLQYEAPILYMAEGDISFQAQQSYMVIDAAMIADDLLEVLKKGSQCREYKAVISYMLDGHIEYESEIAEALLSKDHGDELPLKAKLLFRLLQKRWTSVIGIIDMIGLKKITPDELFFIVKTIAKTKLLSKFFLPSDEPLPEFIQRILADERFKTEYFQGVFINALIEDCRENPQALLQIYQRLHDKISAQSTALVVTALIAAAEWATLGAMLNFATQQGNLLLLDWRSADANRQNIMHYLANAQYDMTSFSIEDARQEQIFSLLIRKNRPRDATQALTPIQVAENHENIFFLQTMLERLQHYLEQAKTLAEEKRTKLEKIVLKLKRALAKIHQTFAFEAEPEGETASLHDSAYPADFDDPEDSHKDSVTRKRKYDHKGEDSPQAKKSRTDADSSSSSALGLMPQEFSFAGTPGSHIPFFSTSSQAASSSKAMGVTSLPSTSSSTPTEDLDFN